MEATEVESELESEQDESTDQVRSDNYDRKMAEGHRHFCSVLVRDRSGDRH